MSNSCGDLPFQGIQTSNEARLEIVGCLANLAIEGVDYFELIIRHDLLEQLEPLVGSPDTEDDILLELVMWIGVMCDERSAFLFAKSTLVILALDNQSHQYSEGG